MFCPDNGPNADYNANGTIKFTASEKVSIKITCPEPDLLAMLDNVLNGEYKRHIDKMSPPGIGNSPQNHPPN